MKPSPERLASILSRYGNLRIAIVGDFCLDRYFEIDPARSEVSIETGLEVHNITRVRAQPGAAGTILNNLVALGIGRIDVIGFCGMDGEGWLLRKALTGLPGVSIEHFQETEYRQTFTYTKPLVMTPGKPPRELNRLDQKNWTLTPDLLSQGVSESIQKIGKEVDAFIVMDQVDIENTGVITPIVLASLEQLQQQRPDLLIISDSRRGLENYPALTFKMNRDELIRWKKLESDARPDSVEEQAKQLARSNGHPVFVSMAAEGIIAAQPNGLSCHEPARPVRGPIDIVGAGDAVTANLTAALAAGAALDECLYLAMSAASCVIHQLGTTGTASREDLMK